MEYRIITETSPESLELKIYPYLQQGWKPYGGIVVESGTLYQTIIRQASPIIQTEEERLHEAQVQEHFREFFKQREAKKSKNENETPTE